MAWFSLEINCITICWIISKIKKREKKNDYTRFLYYLIQVKLSILIFLLRISYLFSLEINTFFLNCLILFKIGIWPFHLWYIKIIDSLEIKDLSLLIIITWQKISPFIIFLICNNFDKFIILFLLLTIVNLIVSLLKISEIIRTKSIMALSSFNNNRWLLISRILSLINFMLFLILYSLTLLITLKELKKISVKFNILNSKFWKIVVISSNLSGLPPFTIFWSKLIIIKYLILSWLPYEMLILLIISSCYFIYHYFWIVINSIIFYPLKNQNLITKGRDYIYIVYFFRTLRILIILYSG